MRFFLLRRKHQEDPRREGGWNGHRRPRPRPAVNSGGPSGGAVNDVEPPVIPPRTVRLYQWISVICEWSAISVCRKVIGVLGTDSRWARFGPSGLSPRPEDKSYRYRQTWLSKVPEVMDIQAMQSMDWLFKKERIYLLAQFWQQVSPPISFTPYKIDDKKNRTRAK